MHFSRLRRHRDAAAILLLALSAFLFMGAALTPEEGRMLYGFDIQRLFHPFGDFMFAAFRRGSLPLWNPYHFLGFPQYAEPQLATFYPLTWPLAWLPAAIAFPLQYAIHFAIAAVGGYLLLRRLGARWSGALLSGFVFAYLLTMTIRIFVGHMPHMMTLAWMPWILLAAHWAAERRSWAAAVVAGLPLGLAFLIGYIPYLILLVPGVSLFMFWLAFRAWRAGDGAGALRIAGQLVVIGLVAAGLSAVQMLPALEFASLSNRAADRYNFADSYPVRFFYLLTLLMPDLFGAPGGDVPFWLELPEAIYWEWALYAGVLPFILFLLAWPVGRPSWRFWVVLGLLGLLAGLGDKGVLHRLLYDYVPGVSTFRFASRPVYFLGLAMAVLTGLVFDRWLDLPPERHRQLATALKRALLLVLVLGFILVILSVLWQASQVSLQQVAIVGGVSDQLIRLLLLGSASLALLIWGYALPRWQVTALALALLVVDLWGVGYKFITDVSQEPELGWVMVDLALPEDRLDYRILTKGLNENLGYFYGFYSIYGYDGFTLEASEKMHDLSNADARIVRLLGGRYLLHGPEWELPITAPGWEVLTEPAGVTIYQREDAGPRAFVVHDVIGATDEADALRLMAQPELDFTQTAVVEAVPNTQCAIEPVVAGAEDVTILDYQPQRVVIEAGTDAGGWLVLNDLYYPGWEATVDGEPAVIQPTNYALRGVCLPAGQHEVIFTFRPRILLYGAAITALTLVVFLVAGAFLWRGRVGRFGKSPYNGPAR